MTPKHRAALAPDRDPRALLRLCHLVSPALPVGAYAYSQGLEYAVQAGWVSDEASTFDWLQGLPGEICGSAARGIGEDKGKIRRG